MTKNILGQFRVRNAKEVALVCRLKGMKLLIWQSWELNIPGGEMYLRELPKQNNGAWSTALAGMWFTSAEALQGSLGTLGNEAVKEVQARP